MQCLKTKLATARSLVMCSLLAVVHSVAGQSVTPTPSDSSKEAPTQSLEQVEIKGKKASERTTSTTTKIVVTEEEITKFGDTSLTDVLKRLPGISVTPSGEIRMRGLGSGYTQILLDGNPAPAGFSLETLSPDLIERIEILRAPTAEHSTQSIAGTINIILKKSAIQNASKLKTTLSERGGRTIPALTLELSRSSDAFSAVVIATERRYSSIYENSTTLADVDPTGTLLSFWHQVGATTITSLNSSIAPRFNWKLDESDSLSWTNTFLDRTSRITSTELTAALYGPTPAYPNTTTSSRTRSDIAQSDLDWTRKFADSAMLDVKFGTGYNDRRSASEINATSLSNEFLLDRTIPATALDESVRFSGKYTAPYLENHKLELGWDSEFGRRAETRIQSDVVPPGVLPVDLDQSFSARVGRLAFFAQDDWDLTPRLSAYLGLRWEGLSTDASDNAGDNASNHSSVFSPILQTLWKLPDSDSDQIRVALARTYRAPLTSSLIARRYYSINNSAVSPDTQGNPQLRPELAWGLDASVEHTLPGGGLISAGLFERRIDNAVINQISLIGADYVSIPTNAGSATTEGIEFDAKLNLKNLNEALPSVDIKANLTRAWSAVASIPGPFNRFAAQIPITANAGLDYLIPGSRWTIGGNFNFTDTGVSRASQNQFTGSNLYREVDAYGLWKYSKSVRLRLAVMNLLRQSNSPQVWYEDSSGTQTSTWSTPSLVTLQASLEITF